jgi:hypothetical protein
VLGTTSDTEIEPRGETVALPREGQPEPTGGLARFWLESQKLAAVVGALLLGHESSHQRADQLTAAPGVKRP